MMTIPRNSVETKNFSKIWEFLDISRKQPAFGYEEGTLMTLEVEENKT